MCPVPPAAGGAWSGAGQGCPEPGSATGPSSRQQCPQATQAQGQAGVCASSVLSSRKTVCARPPGRGPPAGELAAGPAPLHGKAALLTPAGCSEGGQAGCQALLPGFQGAERRVSQPTALGFLQEDRPLSRAGHRGLPQGSLGGSQGRGLRVTLPTSCQALPAALSPSTHGRQIHIPPEVRGCSRGCSRGQLENALARPQRTPPRACSPHPRVPGTCDTGVPWRCVRNTDTQAPQTPEGDAAVSEIPRGLCSFRCGSEPPGSPRTQLTPTRRAVQARQSSRRCPFGARSLALESPSYPPPKVL